MVLLAQRVFATNLSLDVSTLSFCSLFSLSVQRGQAGSFENQWHTTRYTYRATHLVLK